MDKQIVKLALSFGGWVYGGYVRDVLICKSDHFNDIDIAIPETEDVDLLIRALGARVHKDSEFNNTYETNSVVRLVKLSVDSIRIDLVIVKSFKEWLQDETCDLSCNIFFKSSTCMLGIRYIPYEFRYSSDAAQDIMELTEQKRFVVIQEEETPKLERRIEDRVLHGWSLDSNNFR